jgi:hypothetical protein
MRREKIRLGQPGERIFFAVLLVGIWLHLGIPGWWLSAAIAAGFAANLVDTIRRQRRRQAEEAEAEGVYFETTRPVARRKATDRTRRS